MSATWRVRVVDRDATPPPLRRAIGALLEAAFELPLPRERGWIQMEPEFRALAFNGESLVGSCGACRIAADPPAPVYGFADVAVTEPLRRSGVARALVQAAVDEATARGAELLLVATAVLRSTFARLGFDPVPAGRVFYARGGTEHIDRGWMFRATDGFALPSRLCIEGPF